MPRRIRVHAMSMLKNDLEVKRKEIMGLSCCGSPLLGFDFCPYCAPAMRKADIEAINAQYVFGGDHDPILTAARQPYFDYIASLDPPEATETPAP